MRKKLLTLTLIAGMIFAMMSISAIAASNSEFEIENGVLKKYKGNSSTVVIPGNVTSIGPGAFRGCDSVTSVTIPNSVTEIGGDTFFACESLTGIKIPDGVTTIEPYVFWDCENLKEVTIPSSVKEISENAFNHAVKIYGVAGSGAETYAKAKNFAFVGIKETTPPPVEHQPITTWPFNFPMPAQPAGPVTAVAGSANFVIDGKPVKTVATYKLYGQDYLQLRTVAALLNGTKSQFDVGWDGQYATIEPGKAYSGTVTDVKLQSTADVRVSNSKFKLNDVVFSFWDGKLIGGDTNYIQLSELGFRLNGTASQFNVFKDEKTGNIIIKTGVAYRGIDY